MRWAASEARRASSPTGTRGFCLDDDATVPMPAEALAELITSDAIDDDEDSITIPMLRAPEPPAKTSLVWRKVRP